MATFEKHNITVQTDCGTVFAFLGDFRNFEDLVPDQVKNWKADKDSCSFTIEGMADLAMRIDGKYPCNSIHIVSEGNTPVRFTLDYFFREKSGEACSVSIVFDVSLNPFLQAVAKKPLQHFVDLLAERLQQRYAST